MSNSGLERPWYDDPSVLLKNTQFIPSYSMTQSQKFNALSRTVIVASVGSSLLTDRYELLLLGAGILGIMITRHLKQHDNKYPMYLQESGQVPVFQSSKESYNGLPGQVYAQMVNDPSDFSNDLLIDPSVTQRLPLPPSHFDIINGKRYLIDKLDQYDDEFESFFNDESEHLHLDKKVRMA